MRFKIEVTQRDIKNGIVAKCDQCPIARAVNRATKTRKTTVGKCTVTVRLNGRYYCMRLPDRAQDFIRDFDAHLQVKPFTFSLNLRPSA